MHRWYCARDPSPGLRQAQDDVFQLETCHEQFWWLQNGGSHEDLLLRETVSICQLLDVCYEGVERNPNERSYFRYDSGR